jgi:hypothetical protein
MQQFESQQGYSHLHTSHDFGSSVDGSVHNVSGAASMSSASGDRQKPNQLSFQIVGKATFWFIK